MFPESSNKDLKTIRWKSTVTWESCSKRPKRVFAESLVSFSTNPCTSHRSKSPPFFHNSLRVPARSDSKCRASSNPWSDNSLNSCSARKTLKALMLTPASSETVTRISQSHQLEKLDLIACPQTDNRISSSKHVQFYSRCFFRLTSPFLIFARPLALRSFTNCERDALLSIRNNQGTTSWNWANHPLLRVDKRQKRQL